MDKNETSQAKKSVLLPVKKIRNDLMDIRYYYVRKEKFDKALNDFGQNPLSEKAQKYYDAVLSSDSAQLIELFFSLYTKNFTQESLADEMGYTPQHVQRLNKKLILFFQKKFSKGGSEDA